MTSLSKAGSTFTSEFSTECTNGTHDATSASTTRTSTSASGPRRRDSPDARGRRKGILVAGSAGMNTLLLMNRELRANCEHSDNASNREGQKTSKTSDSMRCSREPIHIAHEKRRLKEVDDQHLGVLPSAHRTPFLRSRLHSRRRPGRPTKA